MQNARLPQIRNVNPSRVNGECEACLVMENARHCNAECKVSNHFIAIVHSKANSFSETIRLFR
jgi:hypothetical protein